MIIIKILNKLEFRYGNFSTLKSNDSLKIFGDVINKINQLLSSEFDNISIKEVTFVKPSGIISKKKLSGASDILNIENDDYQKEFMNNAINQEWIITEISGGLKYKGKFFSVKIGYKYYAGVDYLGIVNVNETGGSNADVSEKEELWNKLIEIYHEVFIEFYK